MKLLPLLLIPLLLFAACKNEDSTTVTISLDKDSTIVEPAEPLTLSLALSDSPVTRSLDKSAELRVSFFVQWPYRSIWEGESNSGALYEFFIERDGERVWQHIPGGGMMTVMTPVEIPGGSPVIYSETITLEPEMFSVVGEYRFGAIFYASKQTVTVPLLIEFN
jgi:hypothetical protein